MNTQELHVVFGATGGAGSAVVRELVARGKRVRAVSRHGATNLPREVEVFKGDAADIASAKQAAQGASVVYNCANAPYTKWPEQFPPLWRNVTEAAAAAGAKLVVADNLYMYGPSSAPLTEMTPHRATGRKGRTRIQMTEELMHAHQSGKVQVAVGRSADYYGPGISLAMFSDTAFRKALAGKRVSGMANLDLPHAQAFSDDVGRGLVTLAEHDEAFGEIWHMPHAPAITQREFITMMFEEAGQRPKISVLPAVLLRLAALVVPLMREIAEMAYQYEAPFVVDSSKFKRAFGIKPTPYREGIRRTLEWLREQPQAQVVVAH